MFSALRVSARPLAFRARQFSVASVVRKDLVQDLYLKELKAYKPSAAAVDHAGAVKAYSTPAVPTAPSVPDAAALSAELEAYDASTITPDAAPVAASATEGAETEGADEYLRLVEADVKVEAKH